MVKIQLVCLIDKKPTLVASGGGGALAGPAVCLRVCPCVCACVSACVSDCAALCALVYGRREADKRAASFIK